MDGAAMASLAQYDLLLGSLLVPEEEGPAGKDAFSYLNGVGWSDEIVKACLVDATLDYCGRYVDRARAHASGEEELVEIVSTEEPYCVVVDGCMEQGFPDNYSCRPKVCPLGDMGCRYTGVCLGEEVKEVYREAMGGGEER